MEKLVRVRSDWSGRSVFVTGHTGFKGSWLSLWLDRLGATVHGFALDPPTTPSLFDAARVADVLASDTRGDLVDLASLSATIERAQPELIFHLAAQPLVREGYRDPVRTFQTNLQGTVHLLEAARRCDRVRAVIIVTTDKVYATGNDCRPHSEEDRLGGHDPYSASKAAAELATASYRASFFGGLDGHPAKVTTARAGNVIGGGDWAADRLLPDCLRAIDTGRDLCLRYPDAVRPWQHVLEPLWGYLRLAEELLGEVGTDTEMEFNFGPDASGDATVGEVARRVIALAGSEIPIVVESLVDTPTETDVLRLDSSRACERLGWGPRWTLDEALRRTVNWHQVWRGGASMRAFTLADIAAYEASGQ